MKSWDEKFEKIEIQHFNENVFKLIGEEWFLLTAGDRDSFNTMTASWGTMGVFWHKPIAVSFIRPTRNTFNFTEEKDYYTMSILKDGNRDKLNFCGAHSGRDTDKIAETGLVPVELQRGTIGFEQARLILECKKVYYDDLKPVFFLPEDADEKFYPNKDYHRMYFGEIVNIYKSK